MKTKLSKEHIIFCHNLDQLWISRVGYDDLVVSWKTFCLKSLLFWGSLSVKFLKSQAQLDHGGLEPCEVL